MAADSLLDRILGNNPLFDGALRRRLTQGAVITLSFLGTVAFGTFGTVNKLKNFGGLLYRNLETITSVFNLSLTAAALFLFILAVGTITDVVAELIVVRAAGGVRESIRLIGAGFRRALEKKSVFLRAGMLLIMCLVVFMIMVLWIVSLPCVLFLGVSGILTYHHDVVERFEKLRCAKNPSPELEQVRETFNGLPPAVQKGFLQPFSECFDVSVSYLFSHFSPSSQELVNRKMTRLRDFLSYIVCMVTAVSIPTVILNKTIIVSIKEPRVLIGCLYSAMAVVGFLFLCYFIVLRRTINTLLILATLDDAFLAFGKERNNS